MGHLRDKGSELVIGLGQSLEAILVFILYALIYFTLATILKRIVVGRLRGSRVMRRFGGDGELMIYRSISILTYVLATVAVLSEIGVESSGILTLLSAFTVAVGLSLQDVLKNMFSGLFMLAERPFGIGDRVAVRDKVGTIQGIDIRTTVMKTDDGAILMVPNSVMFTEILQNDSRSQVRYVQFSIQTSLSGQEFTKAVHAALLNVDGVRFPLPSPVLIERNSGSATWSQRLGLDRNTLADDAPVVEALIEALPEATLSKLAAV